MSLTINCSQCQPHLFDLVDDHLDDDLRAQVNDHLTQCEACTEALAGIWEMQAAATRWQDAPVPHWSRRERFFERHSWFGTLQIASACASVLVLVLVMAQVHVSFDDGMDINFGKRTVTPTELAAQLDQFRNDERRVLDQRVDKLTAQQVASNQLILGSVLTASRRERREDLSNLVAAFQNSQDRQAQQIQTSLKYLVSGQLEDRRDIKQLGHALQLVAHEGGTL